MPSRRSSGGRGATLLAIGLPMALAVAQALAGEPSLRAAAPASAYVDVPAGPLVSVLASDANRTPLQLPAFAMRQWPVTQAEFLRFVQARPQWRRDRVPRTFADASYLQHWSTATQLVGDAAPLQPVTQVSWFAAVAFCEDEGARLPTWAEWEYAAAADATRRDARGDPAWLAQILGWYARPASAALPAVGGPPNLYGLRDLHGLVWEWVDDVGALLVNGDSRSADDPDKLPFCGAGAINLQDRQNYAVLMRIALLSSLQPAGTTSSLGFRCVRPANKDTP